MNAFMGLYLFILMPSPSRMNSLANADLFIILRRHIWRIELKTFLGAEERSNVCLF